VIVVDAGEPRNAPAAHMHSYLGHEGLPPSELTAIGRSEVRSYGNEVLSARAVDVVRADDAHFRVDLEGGGAVVARRVVAATGLVDVLPDIEGLREHWGGEVIHCPFCHGYEVRDQRIVQIVTHPAGLHPAPLFRQLTDRLTVVLHEGVNGDDPQLDALRASGVTVLDDRVRRLVTGDDGHLAAVELEDGTRIDADAVAVGPRFKVRVEPFGSLGLTTTDHPMGLGDHVETDPLGETTVPGLYAAGNVTDPSQQVLQAAANGARVGGMISFSLAREDIDAAGRPSPIEAEWDRRYGGEPIWSGNPNGSLVIEVGDLPPGRVLDVGAGEGGDAVWLAEQGWQVTASDVSSQALSHVSALAAQRNLAIECIQADADGVDPFGPGAFDLVSAQYLPIPRSPDGRGIRNLIDAVAPGGTLLVVAHDLDAMRAEAGHGQHRPLIDFEAYLTPEDVLAELADSSDWKVEVHETRPRPGGHSTPHVEDVVLRARRRC